MTTDTPVEDTTDTSRLNEAQRIERAQAEHFQDYTLTKVEELDPESDYKSTVIHTDGMCWSLPVPEDMDQPQVGDIVRCFTRGGFGSAIRGQDLRGEAVYFKTDKQLDFDRAKMLLDFQNERSEKFVEQKAQLDADYESLPQPFKDRLDRFRAEDPTFRYEGEGYESFILVEAAKIAEHFGDADKVEAWRTMDDYKAQRELYAVSDQHSGNTFGCAGMFAERLLRGLEV